MKKIVTVLLTFLFLTSCGYTPMYSQKNFDFKLKNITSTKSDRLNSKVQKRLLSFSNQESQQVFSLKVNTLRKINVLTKNSKGDPSRYEMIIDVKLEAAYGQNLNKSQSFQERFNYNANANKFELKQYEKEIEDLLIDKTIDLIIIYLSKI
tara:strand:+ start:175 stop:627 length:453 start_codon:yes stop_codon:yes gene_type:complete